MTVFVCPCGAASQIEPVFGKPVVCPACGQVSEGASGAITPEGEGRVELVLRDIPREQATREILAFFHEDPGNDSFDAAVALRLDFDLVEVLCEELIEQGHLCC